MGRGSRQTTGHWSEAHPDRHLWTEAQRVHARMQTQEEYEALYGRGKAVEPQKRGLSSPFFPGLLEIPQDYNALRRIEIIAQMQVHERTPFAEISGDPVIAALWQAEIKRVEREREEWKQLYPDKAHWSDEVPEPENMWQEGIVRSWFWEQEDGTVRGWSDIGQKRRIASFPNSYLAAAIETNPLVAERLAQNLRGLLNAGKAQEYFENSLLPDIRYLAHPDRPAGLGHVLGPALAEEIWEMSFAVAGDNQSDIRAHNAHLQEIIERGGGNIEAFLHIPIAPIGSRWEGGFAERSREKYGLLVNPTPVMEAVNNMDWSLFEEGEGRAALRDAAQDVFVEQIVRVYYGLDTPRKDLGQNQLWQEYRKDQKRLSPFRKIKSPLENLRPIFRGENKEDLLDQLIEHYDKEENSPHPHIAAYLHSGFRLEEALRSTVSEEIFRALSP